MNIKNGGAAFPSEGGHRFAVGNDIRKTLPSQGMSLRDYFAAKAMQSILVCDAASAISSAKDSETVGQYVARQSYEMADSMLKEKGKNE